MSVMTFQITSRPTYFSTSYLSKETASVIIWLPCVKGHVVYMPNMFFQHFCEIRLVNDMFSWKRLKSRSSSTYFRLEICTSSSNGGKYTRTQTIQWAALMITDRWTWSAPTVWHRSMLLTGQLSRYPGEITPASSLAMWGAGRLEDYGHGPGGAMGPWCGRSRRAMMS